MSFGIISKTLAPVKPGTVIKLTEDDLKADPVRSASVKVKAMYEVKDYRPGYSSSVGPRQTVKENLLLASLFPNIYNGMYNKKATGTYAGGGAVGP